MKILIHVKQLNPNSTLTFVINDIIGLSKVNETEILCSESSLPESNFEGIRVTEYNLDEKSFRYKVQHFLAIHDKFLSFKNFKLKKKFQRVLKEFNPDLIITNFGDESLVLLQNITVDIPIWVMFHGYDASSWLRVNKYITTYKKMLSRPNIKAITCSKNMLLRMEQAGIPMERSHFLYYGVNIDFFKRNSRIHNKTPVYLQISSFHEKKGHTATLKAFKKYLEDNPLSSFELILAGDGKKREEMIELTKLLSLEDFVSFPGWVNRVETKQLLEKADYFVHHSVQDRFGNMEGIPNAIIEAMAMELPVISTFHSGIPELVSHLENGILVEENDIEEYSKAIFEIKKFGYLSKNRLKIEKLFSVENRIENLQNLLKNN